MMKIGRNWTGRNNIVSHVFSQKKLYVYDESNYFSLHFSNVVNIELESYLLTH